MSLSKKIREEVRDLSDPARARNMVWFFKTGKGEYGEGDIFLGLTSPQCRKIVAKYKKEVSAKDIEKLLSSKIHELRAIALLFALYKFEKGGEKEKREIFDLYISNRKFINNWDLVDISAPKIVGAYLTDKPRGILYRFARSKDLWERRISVLSTFWFIRNQEFDDALKIAEILVNDEHDLIHKAVGWMLRELGKRDIKAERDFLDKHAKTMPRTMLRYAIEKFPEGERWKYLQKG